MNEDLAVEYHQQDTSYYCGAACAQMVLDEVGSGLLSQDDLYTDNHNHSTTEAGWYTAPDGLQWTLNNRQSTKYFCLDALNTEDAISRMIIWTIHHYDVAPVAMVYHSSHWIVIRGYTASAAPGSSIDTTYTISGFDVNNPWPPTPTPGPPPPDSTGDVCGSGGMRGVADEHISYSTWQADYMTGIDFGYWLGKYVAICDPDPPPDRGPRQVTPRPKLEAGDRLLRSEEAADRALRAVEAEGLVEREHWKGALGSRVAGHPVLVQRLDRLDSYYWIVPVGQGERGVPAAVSIDARFGDYRQAIALREPSSNVWHALDKGEIEKIVSGRRFGLPDRLGQIFVRPEAMCVNPILVWRPCQESLSPFYPFQLVTVGGSRLYVRVADGQVFTQLTVDMHGI